MYRALHITPDKCTDCLQCEMACSYENEGMFNISKSRIWMFDFHHAGRKVPYTCTQCAEAWCMHACPVEAIRLDQVTGAKIVVESICIGCKVCTIACQFGTVNYNHDTGKVMKCDLCGGSRPARRRALPGRLPLSVPTGPGWKKYAPGQRKPITGRKRLNRMEENLTWHGTENYCG